MNSTPITFLLLPLLAGGEESIAPSDEELPAPPNANLPAQAEDFPRLLDEAIARLSAPDDAGFVFPDDEIHRDILLPLLPAMLGDAAIREHWAVAGIATREWTADDFEIPVTVSYHAGPDARALADTLLAEPSFRELCAALLNQIRPTSAVELEEPLQGASQIDPFDALLARLCDPGGVPLAELLAEPELLARLTSTEGERCRVIVLPI